MTKAASITSFLQERIDAGDFPSAVYLVAEKGEIVVHEALGYAVIQPDRYEARLDTVYDLASLTKVIVTGFLAAKLFESNALILDEPVSRYLPPFGVDELASITARGLLGHTSGLAAWLPLYLFANDPGAIVDVIVARGLNYPGGSKVVYSDLNFVLVGKILDVATGRSLDADFYDLVRKPLGLDAWNTAYVPLDNTVLTRIAASEMGNQFERKMCDELGYLSGMSAPAADRYFRSCQIWGEVHDLNTYFMEGVAGHAGLFSTAEDVFKISQQFLPSYTTLLKPETCELFRTNFTPGMNEDRSFAFQLASTKDSTAGTRMSPQSFGHTGFTGTSLWIDPVKERVFVLLTNRTHNRELPFANINPVRRRFHDLAVKYLDKV